MRGWGSKMSAASSLAQVLGLVLQGSASNWFGLGCPAHCSGSVLVLSLALVSGVCIGILVALWPCGSSDPLCSFPLPILPSPLLLHQRLLPRCRDPGH